MLPLGATQPEVEKVIFTVALQSHSQPMPSEKRGWLVDCFSSFHIPGKRGQLEAGTVEQDHESGGLGSPAASPWGSRREPGQVTALRDAWLTAEPHGQNC